MNKKLLFVFILVVLFVFTNVSAQTNAGYELALTAFSASASHIQHYESFTVTITPRNIGLNAFPGGEVGAANGGGYGQALTNFYASQYSASHGEQFTVTFQTRNLNSDSYPGGLQGAALIDNSGNIVKVIGSRTAGALNSGSTRTATTINCTVPGDVLSGQYRLRIVIRPTISAGVYGDWRIATMSASADVPNSIGFTVR